MGKVREGEATAQPPQIFNKTYRGDFLDFVSADDDGRLEEFLGVKITSWQLQKPKKPLSKELTPPPKEPTPPPREPTPPLREPTPPPRDPTTNNQQPATNNQQPTTNNQKPPIT